MQSQVWADTNWILIISIVAGSAALAYAGDILGFKYGKKRISIFGLRPRHTSHLITAFTGMFISVVVLTILSFLSDNVRTALFKMNALQQELQTTALNLDITRFERETLRQDRDMLFNEKNDLEVMVSSLRDEAEELRHDLERMRMDAITVPANSLLAQKVIPPGSTREMVEEIIAGLEESARAEVAYKRSEMRYTDPGDVVLIIDPGDKAKVASRALDCPDRLYVRALAAENFAMDEAITVRLESGMSYFLYNEGETVHRKLVRPEEPGFNAKNALEVFLRELRNEAIRNGVRPDPATNKVGSLEEDDYFETMKALKSMETPTIINAVALQDIYTEGPVRIKILLE